MSWGTGKHGSCISKGHVQGKINGGGECSHKTETGRRHHKEEVEGRASLGNPKNKWFIQLGPWPGVSLFCTMYAPGWEIVVQDFSDI